ncbi:MAG TPA: extracellular solute-binding protein [Patescibacteria group bacterium]|nr:extracellular solute-binding protein [Patescibacteria group bacterium]
MITWIKMPVDNNQNINPANPSNTVYRQPPVVEKSTPGANPVPSKMVVRTSPRRKFPAIVIIIPILLIVLVGVYFLAKNLLPGLKKSGEISITWWGLWEDESVVDSLIKEYQGKNPNVSVKYVRQSPQDYRERLTNALAKGNGPDIFRFHNTWIPMFANELDNVPSSFIGAAEYAQLYYPVISSDMASGTGMVGVPLGYDALTLYINEDIFTSEGVNPPSTWNELRETAKKLTKVENGIITRAGVAMGRTENVDHWPEILGLMMIQNGASLTKPTGKLAEDALTFYTVFSNVDGVWDATLPPSTIAFASGNLAMYFGSSWRAFDFKAKNPNLKFKTVPLPQLPKDNPNEQDVSYATYWAEGVWARSPNKKYAWDFLKFVSSKESLEKMYQVASSGRGFGEAYPRKDMADTLKDHPVLGSIIKLAPDAQSWYLASRTFDGPTGINSQINKYFEDAINAVNSGKTAKSALETTAQGVTQVLSQYKLVK